MDNNRRKRPKEVFSKRVRAGKKRTYFFDVKTTRNNDYFLTITESKRDFRQPNHYIKHKIFLYKEDFNNFMDALSETIDHVKTELLPDFPFDMYDHDKKDKGPHGPQGQDDDLGQLPETGFEDDFDFEDDDFDTIEGNQGEEGSNGDDDVSDGTGENHNKQTPLD